MEHIPHAQNYTTKFNDLGIHELYFLCFSAFPILLSMRLILLLVVCLNCVNPELKSC